MNMEKRELKSAIMGKKEYMKPQVKVVKLKQRTTLLSCSGDDCVSVDFKDL